MSAEKLQFMKVEKNGNYIDLSYLDEISGGDQDFIKEIVGLFKQQMPQSVEEMKNSLEENNHIKIGEVAHKAKPSAIYIGNQVLEQKLRELQDLKEQDSIPEGTAEKIQEVETLSNKVIEELNALEE